MPCYEYKCAKCGHIFEFITLDDSPQNTIQCTNCLNTGYAIKLLSKPGRIKIADHYDNLRKNTGCKGFEIITPDGPKPMFNKYKLD